MNKLQVIGSLRLRTDFWDHYDANIATQSLLTDMHVR